MEKSISKLLLTNILGMMFLLSGCLPTDVPKMRQASNVGNGQVPCVGVTCPDYVEPTPELPPKVEIRHLIEPNLKLDPRYSTGVGTSGAGSYQRKITIPKNYAGMIYISGINIGTLQDRHVTVKFKFGLNQDAVVLPAVVSSAPGITPSSNINVLVIDLKKTPFNVVNLLYDLYDYTKYPTKPNGDLEDDVEPVQNNRDIGLYCRGLKLQDDPTFDGVGACDQPNENCHYAYARVIDQGLIHVDDNGLRYNEVLDFPQMSTNPFVAYFNDTMSSKLSKPLPDSVEPPVLAGTAFKKFTLSNFVANSSESVEVTGWDPFFISGKRYIYRGPYMFSNSGQWELKYNAGNFGANIIGPNKLFRKALGFNPEGERLYLNSYLFPLATKLNLGSNIDYLGSDLPQGIRLPVGPNSHSTGLTKWMDGSNARVQSVISGGDHIGACNVVSSMEISAKDSKGQEYIIARTNEIKLQLVRESFTMENETSGDLLSSNFKACVSNANCGGNDCCFNNRCWGRNLVSQCLDPNLSQGSKNNGASCVSDLECSSLCCNSSKCAPHNTNISSPQYCGKFEGQYCIAKEWCRKSTIRKCIIVKNGQTPAGVAKCRLHCYDTQEHGDCINSRCQSPYQEPTPPFNPNDPNECVNAVDLPSF